MSSSKTIETNLQQYRNYLNEMAYARRVIKEFKTRTHHYVTREKAVEIFKKGSHWKPVPNIIWDNINDIASGKRMWWMYSKEEQEMMDYIDSTPDFWLGQTETKIRNDFHTRKAEAIEVADLEKTETHSEFLYGIDPRMEREMWSTDDDQDKFIEDVEHDAYERTNVQPTDKTESPESGNI